GRDKDTEVSIRIVLYELLSVTEGVEIPEECHSDFTFLNTCLSKFSKVKSSLLCNLSEIIKTRLDVALISAISDCCRKHCILCLCCSLHVSDCHLIVAV